MLHVFALGTAGGLLCGLAKHLWFPGQGSGGGGGRRSSSGTAAAAAAVVADGPTGCASDGRAGAAAAAAAAPPSPAGGASGRRRLPAGLAGSLAARGQLAATLAGTALALACAAAFAAARQRHHSGRRAKGSRTRDHVDGRIPLQDLIRFKERQWFVEELENARDADPNAMLRLAKMYLHGQGCQRNIAMAQEWVRKARNMGVAASLDELFATDDPDPRGRLRELAVQEEQRRAMRRLGPAVAGQQQQQQHNEQQQRWRPPPPPSQRHYAPAA